MKQLAFLMIGLWATVAFGAATAPAAGVWTGSPGEAGWRLSVRGPEGKTVELTSDEAVRVPIRDAAHRSGAAWTVSIGGSPTGTVHLDMRLREDRLMHYRLRAELPEGYVVVRAEWPVFAKIPMVPGLKLAAPFGWGLEYDVEEGVGYEGTYPSLVVSMPFVALYGAGERPPRGAAATSSERPSQGAPAMTGLYVGIHDSTGAHKRLAVKARGELVSVACMHIPSDADTVAGRYAPAFHVLAGRYDGDHWEAARIYRQFTRDVRWGGPVAEAPARRAPQWLRDIDLWLMPDAEPLKNVEACRKAGEFFGVPIGLHWYNWHEIPFDTLYPEYFPAKPNFREGVKALQDAGFRVMPYINGRLCDPNAKTWQEGGEAAAARDDAGKPYTEVYGSKVPLHVMCPATTFWRDKVTGIVDRLVNECGVDGVYIDQITAAHAFRCTDAGHGHAPGGGTFWTEGYRRMLDQVRARLPKGSILTSEENAECWNDQFDALLMVNTPAVGNRRLIPLMPAVYAGRVITFGFQYIAGDDVTRSLPFRAKMARCFLLGAQLGWVRVELIMPEAVRKEAEFLRDLARARRDAHPWLLDGEFLGEVEVDGVPRVKIEGGAGAGKYTLDLPAVMATAWMSPDGRLALAAVNMSDDEHTVRLRPRSQPAVVVVTMPARSAKVIEVVE